MISGAHAALALSNFDISLQFPVPAINRSSRQSRGALRHFHLPSLNGHLRDAAITFELSSPDIWPLGCGVGITGSDLQVPRAVVAD